MFLGHIERTLEIKAPPEKVWAVLTDWDRLREWAKSVEKFEVTSNQRSGVGMTFHEVGLVARWRYDAHCEITEFAENKTFAWHSTEFVESNIFGRPKGTKGEGSWKLKLTEAGTQLTYSAEYELPFSIFGKIIDRFFLRGRYEKQVDGWIENIKSLVKK